MSGPVPTVKPPLPPTGAELVIAAPPSMPSVQGRVLVSRVLPVVMTVGVLVVTALVYRSGATGLRSPMFALVPLMMLGTTVTAAVAGRHRRHGDDIDGSREDYLDYLAAIRVRVCADAAAQRTFLLWSHPAPEVLWMLVGGTRMWERRPGDPMFGSVRVGIGPVVPRVTVVAPPQDRVTHADPVTHTALRRFLDTYARVVDAPVTLTVLGSVPLEFRGDLDRVRGLLRALVCQLAVLHAPDILLIAVVAGHRMQHWDWLKWLPHHQHPSVGDAAVAGQLSYPDVASAQADLAGRSAVLIIEDPVGVIRLIEPAGRGSPRTVTVTSTLISDDDGLTASPDFLSPADALVCARRVAGFRSTRSAGGRGWAALMGIGDLDDFGPSAAWRGERNSQLCVPIGTDSAGLPVLLDIKEAAERGSGPHGLCVGATGSGKSELLRTLVLGMIVGHSPEDLNLVLVDFKGGATFLGFERAPHVAAMITNLADEAPLVQRMREALLGELHRRQELLRAAGVSDISGYRRVRCAASTSLPVLPALLVVVDEFAELLSQQPDFIDTFVTLGRLGRSLGVHLLLASQRLDEGRLRGLEAHLSYRVCLKTMSAAESRIVLGNADAHELPNRPGLGFVRTADGVIRGFHAAYVSACYRGDTPAPGGIAPFLAAPIDGAWRGRDSSGPSVLQVVVERLSGLGPVARRIWLAPLAQSPALGDLRGKNDRDLSVVIGQVDRPFEQCRSPLVVSLDGASGHVAVVGAPRSGKSTALQTLIAALCAAHEPSRVVFYCLDFGGGTLADLATVPHVGVVAGRGQSDLVHQTIAEVEQIVARREQRRAATDTGAGPDPMIPNPDVFLVIDGWDELNREFDIQARVIGLASRALAYGVHVVVSSSRWAEIRPALRDLIGTRIELRLGDPAESELDRRQAQQVPTDRPGRGLTHGGEHMILARPQGWQPLADPGGAVAPPIRLLPASITRAELPGVTVNLPVLGIDSCALESVVVDFGRQPHLLITGDAECGKTTALRGLCRELVRVHSAAQLQLLVIDYRRGLLTMVADEYVDGYAMTAPAATALLAPWVARMAERMPGPELSTQQLQDRSWWSGPQLYVVVDDYDLVAGVTGNPLTPLLEYLPHAHDLGLHLVVARRGGSQSRALYDPVLMALLDLGAMRLVMSDISDAESGHPLGGPHRSRPWAPGRGTLITRAEGERLVQVVWER